MCAAFRPPLCLGQQLCWGPEHPLLPDVPTERVRHGGLHGGVDGGHVVAGGAEVRAAKGSLPGPARAASAGRDCLHHTGEEEWVEEDFLKTLNISFKCDDVRHQRDGGPKCLNTG